MRAILRLALCLTALAIAVPSPSAPVQSQSSQVTPSIQDSSTRHSPAPASPKPADTVTSKSAAPRKDTSIVIKPKSRSDTVIVVKHEFNHREQIITGSVIMSCLALILVTMNNYNPR